MLCCQSAEEIYDTLISFKMAAFIAFEPVTSLNLRYGFLEYSLVSLR